MVPRVVCCGPTAHRRTAKTSPTGTHRASEGGSLMQKNGSLQWQGPTGGIPPKNCVLAEQLHYATD